MTHRESPTEVTYQQETEPTDDDLRRDIETGRQELADTVAELAVKVDVKTRASDAAQRKLEQAQRHPGATFGGAVAMAAALIAVIVLRKRHR